MCARICPYERTYVCMDVCVGLCMCGGIEIDVQVFPYSYYVRQTIYDARVVHDFIMYKIQLKMWCVYGVCAVCLHNGKKTRLEKKGWVIIVIRARI